MTKYTSQFLGTLIIAMLNFAAAAQASPVIIKDIVGQKGSYDYPIKDLPEEMSYMAKAQYSDSDHYSCTADVSYPEISGTSSAERINAAIVDEIKDLRCRPQGVTWAEAKYKITFNDGQLISLIFQTSYMEIGFGGGCHGNNTSMTFDIATGQQLRLKDVIPPQKIKALNQYIARYIIEQMEMGKKEKIPLQKDILEPLERRFNEYGIYIENRQLMMDLDSFIESCADGSSYPVPIPKEFINNTRILSALR